MALGCNVESISQLTLQKTLSWVTLVKVSLYGEGPITARNVQCFLSVLASPVMPLALKPLYLLLASEREYVLDE